VPSTDLCYSKRMDFRISRSKLMGQRGMTYTELLIVIAIVAVLILMLLVSMTKQVSRSRDAQRKADLEKIKVSFEDYYNDNGCYPPIDVLIDCRGTSFKPYMNIIPCDPMTGDPYYYVPLGSDSCGGYRVYAGLESFDDPIIQELSCGGAAGCGYGQQFNYGIAAGLPVYDADAPALPSPPPSPLNSPTPTPSPSPSASPSVFVYACDAAGTCNQYENGHPFLLNCPITFQQSDCNNSCANQSNRCNG
jgi:prepilin-type N-terminal cleavage/methylation domain-containing protein